MGILIEHYNLLLLFYLAIYLLSLSVLVSSKKRGFILEDYTEEDFSDSEKSSLESHKKLKQGQFNLNGNLRKSFALEIFLSKEIKNMACSPVSALMPLAKMAIGAKGDSQRELLEAIGISKKSKIKNSFRKIIRELKYTPGVKLNVASRIFVSDKVHLNKNFTRVTNEIFKSSVQKVDFSNALEASKKIDAWIAKESGKSKGMNIGYKFSGRPSSIIINIVTFEGDWETKFRKVTAKEFHSPRGVITVPMMSTQGYYNYVKSDVLHAQLLEIPYEKEKASLVIVLPFSKTGLSVLLKQLKLAPDLLNDAMKDMSLKSVVVSMPKFRIQSNMEITPFYKSVGLRQIFSANSGLTGIIIGEELAISAVWHVAIIDVNEKGTKATAATAVELVKVSKIINEVIFNADHPFLFYIRSANEQIFAGIYAAS